MAMNVQLPMEHAGYSMGTPLKKMSVSLLEYIRSQYFSMQRQSVDSSPIPVKMPSVVRCKQLLLLWSQDCIGSAIKIIKKCMYIHTYCFSRKDISL